MREKRATLIEILYEIIDFLTFRRAWDARLLSHSLAPERKRPGRRAEGQDTGKERGLWRQRSRMWS
nr:MAG TPA: hypothetical protein [Caudoviricetes sp.]